MLQIFLFYFIYSSSISHYTYVLQYLLHNGIRRRLRIAIYSVHIRLSKHHLFSLVNFTEGSATGSRIDALRNAALRRRPCRGKICATKIRKAIEAYRAAPLDSVHPLARHLRATDERKRRFSDRRPSDRLKSATDCGAPTPTVQFASVPLGAR